MKRTPRIPSKLSDSLHHQLNAYAFAASAAGVSLLALADPAQAKIVYTPSGVTFGGSPHTKPRFYGNYYLDLNRDSIPDFVFTWSSLSSFRDIQFSLRVRPIGFRNGVAGNFVNSSGETYNKAFCLGSGASIGPQQPFAGTVMATSSYSAWAYGSWFKAEGYLGLRFTVHGQTHYGWARLKVLTKKGVGAVDVAVLGYAYETIPNKPIILTKEQGPCQRSPEDDKHANPASSGPAEPASLGRLAQGASGFAAWGKVQHGAVNRAFSDAATRSH